MFNLKGRKGTEKYGRAVIIKIADNLINLSGYQTRSYLDSIKPAGK